MHGTNAYRKQAATGWTRIDMLLAVYDATLSALDEGIDVLNRCDFGHYPPRQLRASQLILALLDGIDLDRGEIATRIRDLCVFCLDQISTPSIQNWTNAREVLVMIRDGFAGIREEAIQLESAGQIPPLNDTVACTVLRA